MNDEVGVRDGWLRTGSSGRSPRVLAALSWFPDQVGCYAGAAMRYDALLAGWRAVSEVDVVSIQSLRRHVDCIDGDPCGNCARRAATGAGGPTGEPSDVRLCPSAAETLVTLARTGGYSAVVLSHLWMGSYATQVATAADVPVVLDLHNAEATLYEEMTRHPQWSSLEGVTTHAFTGIQLSERSAVESATVVTVPSTEDRVRLLRRYAPHAPIMVVPNAVPVDEASRPVRATPSKRCLFIGALDYFPNTIGAEKIFEEIGPSLARGLSLPVVVAGRRPPDRLVALSRSSPVQLAADPVEVAELFRDSILIVPLSIGGGSRLKIIEAFAAGCPVVSTTKGIEGIEAEAGVHYLPAQDASEFVESVSRIVRDPGYALEMRQAAWDLAHSRYSWHALAEPVRAVLSAASALKA